MLPLAAIIAAECALLAAIVVLREPKLLIPAVVLGLPMEVLETKTLDVLGSSGISGAIRSLLNPGQAAMAATVVVGAWRCRHSPGRLFPDSSLALPLLGLFAMLFLGVAWSDSLTPANSVLVMPLYLAFVFVAPSLIEDRRDVERILGAFLLAALMLSLLAIAQRLLGVFNWRQILIQSDAYSYRSNATFADPNNLARFLAISMSLAAGLILATGPRRLTVYLAVPALAVGSAGIVATASRSGWIILILCTFLVLIMAPIARYTKAMLTLLSAAGLAAMLGLLLYQGGTDAERVRTLASGVQAIGQREFLIRAGWEMFKDSPLIGVGSGNYQHALIISYLHLIPPWARTTLSHTSIVSILAELGLVGFFLFGFVAVRVGITLGRVYFATPAHLNRLLLGWLTASFVGIVFHSQSEGRLLDEPYLWLLLAILVAFETAPSLLRPRTEADEPPAVALRAPASGPGAPRPGQPAEVPVGARGLTEPGRPAA